MKRSAIVFSTLMHIAFFVLAYVGLPDWWESVVVETPIPVQMVENISDVTTPAPAQEDVETPPPPEAAEEQAVEQPPPPAPTPPPAPQPVEEIPAPEPEVIPEPEPIPEETVEEEPEPEPEVPQEVQLAEQPPAKPEPPEDIPEPEEETENDAFTDLLKDLENVAETQTAEVEPTQTESLTPPQPTSSSSTNLSITAQDAMRRKVESCWNFDAGTRSAGELLVELRLWLNPDGSVVQVEIADTSRMASDDYYRSAAESARRAVLRCAPYLDVLGTEPYDEWKIWTLRFDPAVANR
jgi:outer membrane biosynthesis protein TonB